MADTRTNDQRSRIMKSVGDRDTGPELTIRRLLHRLGYRYRLHRRDLPGRPDIVFPGRRKAIFVHGCFWHGHGCSKGKLPRSRPEYWTAKIKGNQDRDVRVVTLLKDAGWRTLSVWQCELKNLDGIGRALRKFLGPPGDGRITRYPVAIGKHSKTSRSGRRGRTPIKSRNLRLD
jgi:DNA mismatch endonuclease, patch repair protein